MTSRTFRLSVAVLLGFASHLVYAHGGVAVEFDTCVVELGKYRMHFTAYQQATGGQENCWDLPAPGHTILVFDLVETEMRSKPVELRVVEAGEGGDFAPGNVRTIASLPTGVYPTGTINMEASFEPNRRYMAVLTMGDTRPLILKAPIQVVETTGGTNPLLIVLALGAVGGAVFFILRMRQRQQTEAV
jgi:hypothetical protein